MSSFYCLCCIASNAKLRFASVFVIINFGLADCIASFDERKNFRCVCFAYKFFFRPASKGVPRNCMVLAVLSVSPDLNETS